MDDSTNENQDILELEPFDLEMEESDLRRLMAADGELVHIVNTDLDDLGFQIEPSVTVAYSTSTACPRVLGSGVTS